MQLWGFSVNWNLAVRLKSEGRFELVYSEECEKGDGNLSLKGCPEMSDSASIFCDTAEFLAAAIPHLQEPNRTNAEIIATNLIPEHFRFPQDLGDDIDPEVITGTLSPSTARTVHQALGELDHQELINTFKRLSKGKKRDVDLNSRVEMLGKHIDLSGVSGEDLLSNYIKEWEEVVSHAVEHDGGVFIELC